MTPSPGKEDRMRLKGHRWNDPRTRHARLRWPILATAAVELAAIAAAPPPPACEETTQVTAVQLPVQVPRDGQPVRGLTAADFQVFDGKTSQAITGFHAVALNAQGS